VTSANGFFSNASNFQTTAAEVAYGKNVTAALGNTNLHQVVDVARNGAGPKGSEWCDPTGRLIGQNPTTSTGDTNVDAFLWIKPPGEADGCAAAAGVFSADLAYALAGGGTATSSTTTSTSTTTAAGALKCTITKSVSGSWTGAYQALITVKNTGTAASGNPFKVTFSLPSGQTFVNGWGSATLTASGTAVTATGAAALAAGASVSFNFQANASSATLPTTYALNGVTCT
jgi:endoglucanase